MCRLTLYTHCASLLSLILSHTSALTLSVPSLLYHVYILCLVTPSLWWCRVMFALCKKTYPRSHKTDHQHSNNHITIVSPPVALTRRVGFFSTTAIPLSSMRIAPMCLCVLHDMLCISSRARFPFPPLSLPHLPHIILFLYELCCSSLLSLRASVAPLSSAHYCHVCHLASIACPFC